LAWVKRRFAKKEEETFGKISKIKTYYENGEHLQNHCHIA
jgi:hypothetical protein